MSGRRLAAQFLSVVGTAVVAVDRVQPVAAAVSSTGDVLDVVSWSNLLGPPETAEWPGRRVAVDGARVLVQDLPDGDPVAVTLDATGRLRAVLAGEVREVKWGYPRVFGGPWGARGRWTFRSRRDGHRWTSQVSLEGTWDAGRGSIVTQALIGGEVAVVAIRRADSRPWAFRPAHDLVVLDGRTGTPSPIEVPPVDISADSWLPRRPDIADVLAGYAPYMFGQAEVLRKRGGRDVRIGIGRLDDCPVVEWEFGLDARPGVRFFRRDEPLDELGRVAGLAFWTVLFEEERLDLLLDAPPDGDGRVPV